RTATLILGLAGCLAQRRVVSSGFNGLQARRQRPLGNGSWLLLSTDHPVHTDSVLLSLQTDIADALGLEACAEPVERRLADEDTNRSGVGVRREKLLVEALEPRRGVHRVAHHHVLRTLRAAQRTGDHGTGEDTNTHPRGWPVFGAP